VIGDVCWQANENFVEDGIHIEPFNLEKEREEGYFDASGNFVEYVRDNEIKVRYFYFLVFFIFYSQLFLFYSINKLSRILAGCMA
jgi:hypothetical protein